jgi:arginase
VRRQLNLLYPEWQSYGESTEPYQGAVALSRALFSGTHFTDVDAPLKEQLRRHPVVGLHSIAPRFIKTRGLLRHLEPTSLLVVGGTCGADVAPIAYLNEHYSGGLAVIWFDAHADLNTPESSPTGHFHGMALRTLLGEGPSEFVRELKLPLQSTQVFLVGARDLDLPELEHVKQNKLLIWKPEMVDDTEVFVGLVSHRGFRRVYIHLDLDCFRPEEIPDSLIPTAGGPSVTSVISLISALSNSFEVVGFSLLEYVDRGGESLSRISECVPQAFLSETNGLLKPKS